MGNYWHSDSRFPNSDSETLGPSRLDRTSLFYIGAARNEYGYAPFASLTVKPPTEKPLMGRDWVDVSTEKATYLGLQDDGEGEKNLAPHYQHQMFEHQPMEITEAFSDPRVRHTIPTLVGLAMTRFREGMPTVSDNLSIHSSKLAANAVGRGLAEPHEFNPNMEVSNSARLRTKEVYHYSDGTPELAGVTPVSAMDVAAGKMRVRQLLNRDRKPQFAPEPETEQLRLF